MFLPLQARDASTRRDIRREDDWPEAGRRY